MPTHIENKSRRKEQILRAARILLTEGESDDFSMEALATRAGVSLPTPYNLFGSKSQVIVALHAWETEAFRRRIGEIEEEDPIRRLLLAADEAMDSHLADERYFKALCRAAFNASRPIQVYDHTARSKFFIDELRRVADAGLIRKPYDVSLLASILANLYLANIHDWAGGDIPSPALKPRMGYAIAIAMLGVVIPSRRRQLHALVTRQQSTLAEMGGERSLRASLSA
jgi:AcrR family transcriptional regulator